MTTITGRSVNGVQIKVIHADVGAVAKSDLLMAQTGSRLVVGFNVDVMPEIPQLSREQGVEVRLYEVIYRLSDDLHQIARSLITKGGAGKSDRKGPGHRALQEQPQGHYSGL